jgi:zinc protease
VKGLARNPDQRRKSPKRRILSTGGSEHSSSPQPDRYQGNERVLSRVRFEFEFLFVLFLKLSGVVSKKLKKRRFSLIFLFFLSIPLLQARTFQEIGRQTFPITQHTLKNGLRVILTEDNTLPIVSVVVAYKVGSINEKRGKTGLAHLLENLMFQGSRNVGQMQHISFIQRIGGILNAVTTEDKTIFYQNVPSNQLALVLWLESDRMKTLNISTANVESTKNSLIEDIQQRQTVDPYLENFWYFERLLFPNFSYGHPILGTVPDIKSITVEDVESFFSSYYSPNNAVLSIAGYIDKNKVIELVEKYFSTIPMRDIPPSLPLEKMPSIESTEISVKNSFASSPGFLLGYQIAPRYSEDYYPLALTEYVLMKGLTSRMPSRLLQKDKTAIDLSGGIQRRKDQAAFRLFVRATNELMNERNQRAVFSEINKLKTAFVPQKELQKTKNMFKMDFYRQYATVLDKAIFLAEMLLNDKDLDQWPDELDKYLAVTHYDIARVVNKYFNEERILLNIETK